ncbi:hypothetical protein AVEN_191388-1 [Araneus ventricosus]|uniref:Uncharacterized protein n=1 Tax=Araneus ventricosus TaxID=182803 RepID=A0A4Y2W2D4_ARAVE|nr:hypothetical protein AVEN_191388-1 [Araneus ventricosus]
MRSETQKGVTYWCSDGKWHWGHVIFSPLIKFTLKKLTRMYILPTLKSKTGTPSPHRPLAASSHAIAPALEVKTCKPCFSHSEQRKVV